jgi:transcriptional regulator with XRE-family HTH domain
MDNILGQRIRELRCKAALSQMKFAKELNLCASTVSQYETGNRSPSDQIKLRIADYFNVSLDYLMGRNGSNKSSYSIEIRKNSLTQQEIEDLRTTFSIIDDSTVRALIELLKRMNVQEENNEGDAGSTL